MSEYRIVWKVRVEIAMPPGSFLVNENAPTGEGATPEQALAALTARLDANDATLKAQRELLP